MSMIKMDHVTKDYGNGKGIFDISMQLHKGEVYGYLGPNGAGKTTTIRHLLGFIKADSGTAYIRRKNCWTKQKEIQKIIGYLPGEIAFPNDMKGSNYLKMVAKLRGMKNRSRMEELLQMFEVDTNTDLKRMSKGMKQKIGIVSAFMHNPDILILDEPTSGLDPLMQHRFMELMEQEKAKGKTILMSSHRFDEVERTCSRIGIIKNGCIMEEHRASEFATARIKTYIIRFVYPAEYQEMCQSAFDIGAKEDSLLQMSVHVNDLHINALLRQLSKFTLSCLQEEKHNLEDYFMNFYGGVAHD